MIIPARWDFCDEQRPRREYLLQIHHIIENMIAVLRGPNGTSINYLILNLRLVFFIIERKNGAGQRISLQSMPIIEVGTGRSPCPC